MWTVARGASEERRKGPGVCVCVSGVGGCEWEAQDRERAMMPTRLESVRHSRGAGSTLTPPLLSCNLCFLRRFLERGPQGRDGHLEALEAEAVSFWPSQLKEHVGLKLGECVLRAGSHAPGAGFPCLLMVQSVQTFGTFLSFYLIQEESFLELAYKLAKVSSSRESPLPRCQGRMAGGREEGLGG